MAKEDISNLRRQLHKLEDKKEELLADIKKLHKNTDILRSVSEENARFQKEMLDDLGKSKYRYVLADSVERSRQAGRAGVQQLEDLAEEYNTKLAKLDKEYAELQEQYKKAKAEKDDKKENEK
ncbi:hypothetical protein ACLHIM_03510 [Ligilactobacillus sp. LYQ112]|uniref:hypothetical protein n=1 Tax=Ligilactobacillus sp. LYQ112 TaxID=3391060 RepID=UPI0039834C52